MSTSTGGLSTQLPRTLIFSPVWGKRQPPSHTQQPLDVQGRSAQPRGARASRGCSRKRRGASSLTVPESRCSQGALTWSQRHTPISSSYRGQAVPAAGQACEERGRGRIQVMRGPGRGGPRGSAALGLEGPLVGCPGLGVPLSPWAPCPQVVVCFSRPQSRAMTVSSSVLKRPVRCSLLGEGLSPSSGLALGSLPRPCAPCLSLPWWTCPAPPSAAPRGRCLGTASTSSSGHGWGNAAGTPSHGELSSGKRSLPSRYFPWLLCSGLCGF